MNSKMLDFVHVKYVRKKMLFCLKKFQDVNTIFVIIAFQTIYNRSQKIKLHLMFKQKNRNIYVQYAMLNLKT